MESQKRKLIEDLKEIGVIKRGEFTLKNGEKSDIYIDFRKVISYPEIFSRLCVQLSQLIDKDDDCILCGVPLGAVPYTVMLSYFAKMPMILVRKDRKNYGTQKMIEGDDTFEEEVVIIEDVITSGSSVLDTVLILEEEGKEIRKIIAILDRGNNKKRFEELGYKLETLFTIEDFVN